MNNIIWVMHCFRPTETIQAILKLKNNYNLTDDELEILRNKFNELNNFEIPRPGMNMKIPVFEKNE